MSVRRVVGVAGVLAAALLMTACGSVYAQGGRQYPYPTSRGPGAFRVAQDPAYARGYEDGYRRGLDAARRGHRHNLRIEQWYRSADRGYDRRYGSRNQWRQVYRDGFSRGYDIGYRDARYDRGRNRRW